MPSPFGLTVIGTRFHISALAPTYFEEIYVTTASNIITNIPAVKVDVSRTTDN